MPVTNSPDSEIKHNTLTLRGFESAEKNSSFFSHPLLGVSYKCSLLINDQLTTFLFQTNTATLFKPLLWVSLQVNFLKLPAVYISGRNNMCQISESFPMANTSINDSFIFHSRFKDHKTCTEKQANGTQCFEAAAHRRSNHTQCYLTSAISKKVFSTFYGRSMIPTLYEVLKKGYRL
jgi:hypothetical protein